MYLHLPHLNLPVGEELLIWVSKQQNSVLILAVAAEATIEVC